MEVIARVRCTCEAAGMPCKGCQDKKAKGAAEDGARLTNAELREDVNELAAATSHALASVRSEAYDQNVRLLIVEIVAYAAVGLALGRAVAYFMEAA